jgi:hypothetical protein
MLTTPQAITGRDATLSTGSGPSPQVEIEVKGWTYSPSNAVKSYASSATSGWKATVKGVSDWKFKFNAVLPNGAMKIDAAGNIVPGTLLYVVAKVAGNGSNPSYGTISGYVRVESIEDAVEIDGGEMAAPVNCSGHLAPSIT